MYTLLSKFLDRHHGAKVSYTLVDIISWKKYVIDAEQLEYLIKNGIEIDNYKDRKSLPFRGAVLILFGSNAELIQDSVNATRISRYITFNVDSKYRDQVDKLYQEYIDGCKLIGKNNEFEYVIKDKQVVIKKYLGNQSTWVVPEFVSAISSSAEVSLKNVELVLQEGMQFIGTSMIKIRNVPSTVKLFSISAKIQPSIISSNVVQVVYKERRPQNVYTN